MRVANANRRMTRRRTRRWQSSQQGGTRRLWCRGIVKLLRVVSLASRAVWWSGRFPHPAWKATVSRAPSYPTLFGQTTALLLACATLRICSPSAVVLSATRRLGRGLENLEHLRKQHPFVTPRTAAPLDLSATTW